MEIIEAVEDKLSNCTMQSQWLQATILGVSEKMKEVTNLLKDDDGFSTQNLEIYNNRKEAITEIVKELCTSYYSLAEEYDHHLQSTKYHHLQSTKCKRVSASWDDSQNDEKPESVVESVVEHSDIDEFEEEEEVDENLTSNDTKQEKVVMVNSMKLQFTKLVEANTELQMELVRRNTAKREMISKLQEEVSRLMAEKDALKRHLSYIERRKPNLTSSSRGVLDRIFRCSF